MFTTNYKNLYAMLCISLKGHLKQTQDQIILMILHVSKISKFLFDCVPLNNRNLIVPLD